MEMGTMMSNRKLLNKHSIARTVGAVLAILGIISVIWANVPYAGTKTRVISYVPDITTGGSHGVQTWILMRFSLWYQGEFSGSLTWSPALEDFGETFGWVLVWQSKFDQWKETGGVVCVYASQNLPSVPLMTTGHYYLLLFNIGPGAGANWSPPQQIDREYNVTVHYRLTGIQLGLLIPGCAFILAACPILIYGRILAREQSTFRSSDGRDQQ